MPYFISFRSFSSSHKGYLKCHCRKIRNTKKNPLTPNPLSAHLELLPRLLLSTLNPLLISLPLRILLLNPNNPLHDLPNKPNKITPSERILPLPRSPLSLLPLKRLHIPNLPRPPPRIPHNSHKIEMRLLRRVSRNALLQNLNNLLREFPSPTRPMADRMRLQSIKLIQRPIDRRIRNEVVNIRALLVVLWTRRLIGKRARPRKAVVRAPDRFRVRERFAAQLRREARCEVFEGA